MSEPLVRQAFILGAGMGSRMAPLTDTIPKPLVPLAGKPLIDHVIDGLAAVGVQKFIVNVHYRADQLEAHLKARKNLNITISDERGELLDTGGGLKRASRYLENEPFFIHNSDSVWLEGANQQKPNLQRMVETFDPDKMQSLMLLADRHNALGYNGKGDFLMKENNRLQRRGKTEVDYVFAGVSIAAPRLLDNAPDGPFSLNLLWNNGLSQGAVYGIAHQGRWMHVGTIEALKEAEKCMSAQKASI